MRHAFVRVLGILTLAIVALLPLNAHASRSRPPSDPGAMALQGPLGIARYSGLPMDKPSSWRGQAAHAASDLSEFEGSALDLGSLPSAQRQEASAFDPLRGIALVDVDRIRGPPGLPLENRIWSLQILGQGVVVAAEGVSTRLVWSCGRSGYDAAWYDCARYEYDGSAPLRKHRKFRYGLECHKQAGLSYLGNRWYDPETGSFVSADPLGFPDSMNQYAWGVGNYWKADPLGLESPGLGDYFRFVLSIEPDMDDNTMHRLLVQRREAMEKIYGPGAPLTWNGPISDKKARETALMNWALDENNRKAIRPVVLLVHTPNTLAAMAAGPVGAMARTNSRAAAAVLREDIPPRMSRPPANERLERVPDPDAGFSKEEKRIAEYLRGLGRRVDYNQQQNTEGAGRQGDALVDGMKTEFKTIKYPNPMSIKNAVNDSLRGTGQARTIVIDARGTGLTEGSARQGMGEAFKRSRGKLDYLAIIGEDYFVGGAPPPRERSR